MEAKLLNVAHQFQQETDWHRKIQGKCMNQNSEWEAVIGLEVHVQLATQSKLFSGAATTYGALPNTQACIIDLGFPRSVACLK